MNNDVTLPALSTDAIFGKSKLYISKALLRKEKGDLDEYQLWASLALELLGKSALCKIHPSLIVDPTHAHSLFAASGNNISTDIKTIGAHTLFDRLRYVLTAFDEKAKKFCIAIALRRNAELHSGETPFRAMRVDAWEAQFWHASDVILKYMNSSFDEWLGAPQAEGPRALLAHLTLAKQQAITINVGRLREAFLARPKAERDAALALATSQHAYNYRDLFTFIDDTSWPVDCPSCGGKAYLGGLQVQEEVIDTYHDEHGAWESVEKTYTAEQFKCPTCTLFLDGEVEISTVGLDLSYSETDERELQYEPDYGND